MLMIDYSDSAGPEVGLALREKGSLWVNYYAVEGGCKFKIVGTREETGVCEGH